MATRLSGLSRAKEAALIRRAELLIERRTAPLITKEIKRAMKQAASCLVNGQSFAAIEPQHIKNLYAIIEKNAIESYAAMRKIYKPKKGKKASDEGFGYTLEAAIAYINKRGGEKIVKPIAETTLKNINRLVISGIENGKPIASIASDITAADTAISYSRAQTIARTETHFATMTSIHDIAQAEALDLGLTAKKEWIAASDARETHAEANGQTVGMNDHFIVGGEALEYAGDPNGSAENVINCRCVIGYIYE